MQYVMHFRFCYDVIFSRNGPRGARGVGNIDVGGAAPQRVVKISNVFAPGAPRCDFVVAHSGSKYNNNKKNNNNNNNTAFI